MPRKSDDATAAAVPWMRRLLVDLSQAEIKEDSKEAGVDANKGVKLIRRLSGLE